jgi:hypothetical protein
MDGEKPLSVRLLGNLSALQFSRRSLILEGENVNDRIFWD